jgi:hypothetical protein
MLSAKKLKRGSCRNFNPFKYGEQRLETYVVINGNYNYLKRLSGIMLLHNIYKLRVVIVGG